MRDFAKNCAIVWSCLCAAWAIFGFYAGATGRGSTGGTMACCGGASSATAFVAWVIGLVPCALLALIGGQPPSQPSAPESKPTAQPEVAPQAIPQTSQQPAQRQPVGFGTIMLWVWFFVVMTGVAFYFMRGMGFRR